MGLASFIIRESAGLIGIPIYFRILDVNLGSDLIIQKGFM
jgi:hypothetical protein